MSEPVTIERTYAAPPERIWELWTMTMQPMHDDVWTERLVAGRTNELDNLAAVV